MSIKQSLGHVINTCLGKLGYRLERIPRFLPDSVEEALQRLESWKIDIQTIIDVGASNGAWSERVRQLFPGSVCYLIEANSCHEPALQEYCRRTPRTQFILSAAGDEEGEIFFDARNPFGGAAFKDQSNPHLVRLPMTTIDAEVRKHSLKPPYLIKLDTHGFEVPIFNGALQTLSQTSLIVVEVYNFQLHETSLRFHQMCEFLEDKGFRPVAIFEPLYRARDQILWQMDMLFVPKSRPEFLNNEY